jgi:nucleotide-binding universal stress UspA family protein
MMGDPLDLNQPFDPDTAFEPVTRPSEASEVQRSAAPERTVRIIVGVDGSPSSLAALRKAVVVASAFRATVEAIGVWHVPSTSNAFYPAGQWSPREDASAMMAEAAEAVFGDAQPPWFRWSVREGSAARVLIAASRDADLLIVGSRGHSGVVGLLLGSVSAACAEGAQCPVLIMH